jgi:hypothetical protein
MLVSHVEPTSHMFQAASNKTTGHAAVGKHDKKSVDGHASATENGGVGSAGSHRPVGD